MKLPSKFILGLVGVASLEAIACSNRIIDGVVQPNRCFPFLYIAGVADNALREANFEGVWFAHTTGKEDAGEPYSLGTSLVNRSYQEVEAALLREVQKYEQPSPKEKLVAAIAYRQYIQLRETCEQVPVVATYKSPSQPILISSIDRAAGRISAIPRAYLEKGCTPK